MKATLQIVADFAEFVDFHIIYIMEAHPVEGWATPEHNDDYGVCYNRPIALQER
jgi:hypothetical protein